jgi:hypothetical protein
MWRIESLETRIVKERAWKTEIALMQKVRHTYLECAGLAALSIESRKESAKAATGRRTPKAIHLLGVRRPGGAFY